MKLHRLLLWATIAGLATSVGCASTSDKNVTSTSETRALAETRAPAEVSIEPKRAATVPQLKPIYFEYDAWTLSDDARNALRANANLVREHAEWGVLTIEGHCDERGSDEYNVALGQRRATVVKRYMVDLGVPASRLATVSFGEYRPAMEGHDESAWGANRRGVLALEERHVSRR